MSKVNMFEKFVPNGVVPADQKTALDHKKDRFLELLVTTGVPSASADAMGETRTEVYRWRARDPLFARKWDDIIKHVIVPILEDEAARRALAGSDTLLMFLLKAYNRKVFDDKVALLSQTGTNLSITIKDADGKVVATTDTLTAKNKGMDD